MNSATWASIGLGLLATLIVAGIIAGILGMVEGARRDEQLRQFRQAAKVSDSHMQGFMDGVFWAAANPFPTNEEGKIQVDLAPILQAQGEAWNRRQKENAEK